MSRRLKVLVFLDHPIIVRHFVASGAFAEIESRHDVRYVTLPEGHKRIRELDISMLPADRLIRLPESAERNAIWQRMFQIDSLRGRLDPHTSAVARHHANAIGEWTARIYRFYGLPFVWPVYRRILLAKALRVGCAALEALLEAERPDAVVHPTVLSGLYLNDLVDVLGRRHTPLVAIMNSWDNPSTKRAMVGHPDRLLVWGPQTRAHALRFAGMPSESVVEFGAAQFEVYRSPPSMDRDEFCRRHAIDPARTVVLYAGSSKGCDEYADLDVLEREVESGRLAGVSIVYRPHPWGNCGRDGGRIAARAWKHVAFETTMAEYVRRAGAGRQGITTPDYRHTRDVLASVDAVVSPLSTILLEAAMNGKPPLCFVDDADVGNWFLSINREFVHFGDFFERPEFAIASGRGELAAGVAEIVARSRDVGFAAQLKRATEFFVTPFEAPYALRLADFVESRAAA